MYVDRGQALPEKLPGMSEDEQRRLLASDGMLVKRPLVAGEDFILTGSRKRNGRQNCDHRAGHGSET